MTIGDDPDTVRTLASGYSIIADAGDDGDEIPRRFALMQNFPNPFNPTTTIGFSVPFEQHITIAILNLLGQRVTTLVYGVRSGGVSWAEWDGRDFNGKNAPSGLYLYRFRAGAFSLTRKLVLSG